MTHDHSHDHHHGHSHSHSHDHGHSHDHAREMSMEDKLETLFAHWVDHNDSHKDNFVSWAAKAREAGLETVAQSLEQAGALSEEVTEKLRQARKALKG